MVDIVRAQGEQIPGTMHTRYVDMEDGTHALVVAIGAGGSGASVVEIARTPAITAGAYGAGDALGGRMGFDGAVLTGRTAGTITKVVIVDDADQGAPIDIVFFSEPFAATADNAPFDPADADMQNCLGYIDMAATDYSRFANNGVATKTSGLRMPFDFVLPVNGRLYAQMGVRGAPTYVATDDLTIKITVERR